MNVLVHKSYLNIFKTPNLKKDYLSERHTYDMLDLLHNIQVEGEIRCIEMTELANCF